MNTHDMMYFVSKYENELDREIVRTTKQKRQRRAVHHDHKPVREFPKSTVRKPH